MVSRREFLRHSAVGTAAAGLGALLLPADAAPTESSGDLGDYKKYRLGKPASPETSSRAAWAPTEDNILGPFHRTGAPYRAKITPPFEPGEVLLVSGRVWGFDSRKPLPWAELDIWQANAQGRYDNDDPAHLPAQQVFLNRARLIADESGYYEFETIHPGRYKIDVDIWRPSHIHYWVRHQKYQDLVTQLYFEGDPYNATDQFIKKSLIRSLQPVHVRESTYHALSFDIILKPAREI